MGSRCVGPELSQTVPVRGDDGHGRVGMIERPVVISDGGTVPDQLAFVQFPHPGGEGNLRSHINGVKPWGPANRPHLRAFMRTTGTWVSEPGATHTAGQIKFWGEWEGASRITALEPNRQHEPRYLHDPLRSSPPPAVGDIPPQNTDPFVFGDRFLYTYCRQDRNRGLRQLAPGSVVVFGSKLGNGFALDTVFVVESSIDHLADTNRRKVRKATSPLFEEMTMRPMYGWGEAPYPRRLYLGATHDQPVNGRFSFVPCSAGDGEPFARPQIELPSWMNPNLAMGARVRPADERQLQKIWDAVVSRVVEDGLMLGVQVNQPSADLGDRL